MITVNANTYEEIIHMIKKESKNIKREFEYDDRECVPVWFTNAIFNEDRVWFSGVDFNGLFRGNINTGKVELIDFFPEALNSEWLHFRSEIVGKNIYFIYDGKNKVNVFDIERNVFTDRLIIPFKQKNNYRITFSYTVKDDIYLFGNGIEVYKLNTKNNTISYLEKLSREMYVDDNAVLSNQIGVRGNTLFIPVYKSNIIMEVNLKKNYAIRHLFKEEIEICGCYYDRDIFWISGNNMIMKCDEKFDIISEFVNNNKTIKFDFQEIRRLENQILFLDNGNKGILKLDLDSLNWSYIFGERKYQRIRSRWNNVLFFVANNLDDGYFFDLDSYTLKNLKDDKVNVRFLVKRSEIKEKIDSRNRRMFEDEKIIKEDDKLFTLDSYLDEIEKMVK